MSRHDPFGAGVWVAYYADGSGFVMFATEVEALRHAVDNGMMVRFARFGDEDWQTRPKESVPPTLHNTGGCRETRTVNPASFEGLPTS